MDKISKNIVKFISKNMPIDDEEMLDVYKYGIEITLSSLINFVMIIVCSLLLGDLTAGLVFMVCFILIRSYTGGYHAETYLRCNIAFVCTFILTYFVSGLFAHIDMNIYASITILLFGIIPIIKFAPVKNKHKPLSKCKRKKSRIISLILYILFFALSIFMHIFNTWYGYMVMTTILSVSVLILVEVFMQKKGYHISENLNTK